MRGGSIIERMVIDMNEAQVRTLEQVRQVLEGTQLPSCYLTNELSSVTGPQFKKLQHTKREAAKIEQFYFLPVGWLGRSIAALKDEDRLRAWWGRDDIEVLRATTNVNDQARLFTQRFRRELGYASAAAWPIFTTPPGNTNSADA